MLLQETRAVTVCFCTVKVSPTVCDNANWPYKGKRFIRCPHGAWGSNTASSLR